MAKQLYLEFLVLGGLMATGLLVAIVGLFTNALLKRRDDSTGSPAK